MVVAVVGHPEIGEASEVRSPQVGRCQPVGEDLRGGVHRVLGVDQLVGDAGYGAQLDRDDVVEDPAAVWEPGRVAAQQPEDARLLRGRDGRIEPQQV